MSIPLTQKRRGLIFGGLAVIALFFGALIYLATVNPPWSPIPQFRGDGKGTSYAAQERKDKEEAKIKAQERLEGALQFVPETAVAVSHANLSAVEGGQAWWSNYRNLFPPHYQMPQDLPDDLGVTSLTYALFPTASEEYSYENPFSHAIVLTAPAEQSEKMLGYVNENSSADFYAHLTQDEENAFIILSEVYAYDEISALIQDKDGTRSFAALQRAEDFSVDAPTPTMYADFNGYLDVYAAYRSDKTEFLNSLFTEGVGLEEGTTWLGTSTDQGKTWTGTFLGGGVNYDKVDPEKFQVALQNEMEFIWAEDPVVSEDGGGVFEYGYASPGMSALEEALSVSKGDKVVGGVLNPHNGDQEPVVAPESEDGEIVIVFSPQMVQGVFQSAIKPSSIKTITLRAKAENATLVFDYYEDEDFAVLEVPETSEQNAD